MTRFLFGLAVAAAVAVPAVAAEKSTSCGFGTAVDFVDAPREAAVLAGKDEKLVFVLHVSGHFEDPRFT